MLRTVWICLLLSFSAANAEMMDEFSAEYEIFYGDYNLGQIQYRLQHHDNGLYRFHLDSKIRFLLLFSDHRKIVAEFNYQQHQLKPVVYNLKRAGTGTNYTEDIRFDSASREIRSQYKNHHIAIEYNTAIKDSLSMQLQLLLDLRRGIDYPQYLLLENNTLKTLQFERIREETIAVEGKKYRCVMYQLRQKENNHSSRMWFAIDYGFQPVLMAHYKDDKKRFNARLVSYQENPSNEKSNFNYALQNNSKAVDILDSRR